jgi:rod shape-determining protein MreD
MLLTIAAAAAVVAALVEYSVASYLRVGAAVPHPVLVLGVIWTIAGGFEGGLTWAFVGGLALDILAQRPLGSSAFALLIALALAALVGGLFARVRIVAPIVATAIASVVYTMLLVVAISALSAATLAGVTLDGILASALYDTILAALIGPLVIAIVVRRRDVERPER